MQNSSHLPALDIQQIIALQEAPRPFTPGEPQFWTDPHIAQQMLAAHLDPNLDAASRHPDTIQRSVDWIVQILGLNAGERVLDLGCGPGLYATCLARAGLNVTGVDFSQNSIDYAVQFACKQGLEIEYRCQNYLELEDKDQYAAALLIFGDLCPLAPEQRARLLGNIRRALKPGGRFVADVSTPHVHQQTQLRNGWHAEPRGFWKPDPHLVLEQGFAYPDDLYLDQYIVIQGDGNLRVYRNWFQDYTPERLRAELKASGFVVDGLWGDLCGAPFTPNSDWIGFVARRM